MLKKEIITTHPELYIAKFTQNIDKPYVLFIHGGPGFNSGALEYLIENEGLFSSLNYNLILYDQRSCGRSKSSTDCILHNDNINDLQEIIRFMSKLQLELCGLIGHSYGAKLLYDYYKMCPQLTSIPGIFVSTAESILIPRMNNLMLDLTYLKKVNPEKFKDILKKIDDIDLHKIWNLTEELNPIFQENNDRPYLYWANMDCFKLVSDIQKKINLPTNKDTFNSVRKDLYSNEKNYAVNISDLDLPYLWINGFHDYVMDGHKNILNRNNNIKIFFKSAHYPHIEENILFCECVNEFIGRYYEK